VLDVLGAVRAADLIRGEKPAMRKVVLALVLGAGLLGLLLYSQRRVEPFRVSGFIEADELRVGSHVGGRVLRGLVEEGERVPEDGVLFELEPFDLLERRAQAVLRLLRSGFRREDVERPRAAVRQDSTPAA